MRDYTRIYIDGAWVKPLDGKIIDVINPATERPAGHITLCTAADVDRAVEAARKAFITFSRSSRQERLDLLSSILGVYAKRQDDLADVLTEELGAPKKFAKEVQVGVGLWHLQTAIAILKDYKFEYPQSNRTVIHREPIGVVGAITPWNWPINQVVIKAFPAFATGCTVVHKPSEVAPFTTHVLAEIFHEAGVPPGVYNLVDGDGPAVGAAISGHPGIRMVSFTGSTAAGIDVAKRAADNVKRVHQELGGKSPNIILDDADLAKAVTENIYRLMLNSGQSCHAPTRMLVPFAKMETAKNIAKQVIASITLGNPETDVYMGPVVSERQWNRIESLIQKGIDEGATLVTGGTGHPDGLETGYYVKPTVFADVRNDMIVAREEIFGPVLCIIGYKDVDDAVSIANDTVYGLAAYVQSASEEHANNVAARLEAGMVLVNGASEDPLAPFGGYKMSGIGCGAWSGSHAALFQMIYLEITYAQKDPGKAFRRARWDQKRSSGISQKILPKELERFRPANAPKGAVTKIILDIRFSYRDIAARAGVRWDSEIKACFFEKRPGQALPLELEGFSNTC